MRRRPSSTAASRCTTTSICATPIIFPSGLINSPDIVAALGARPTEIQKSDYLLYENGVCTGCHGGPLPGLVG